MGEGKKETRNEKITEDPSTSDVNMPMQSTAPETMPTPSQPITGSFEDLYIDHLAHRVSIAGLSGLAFGAAVGTMGGAPLLPTSLSMAMSWAVSATTCLGSERLFFAAIPRPFPYLKAFRGNEDILAHICGGILGGSLIGTLYKRRPLSGVVLFSPLMFGVALVEREFATFKRRRIEEICDVENSQK